MLSIVMVVYIIIPPYHRVEGKYWSKREAHATTQVWFEAWSGRVGDVRSQGEKTCSCRLNMGCV